MLSRRAFMLASLLPLMAPARSATAQNAPSALDPLLAPVPALESLTTVRPGQLLTFTDMRSVLATLHIDQFPVDELGDDVIQAVSTVPLDSPLYPNARLDWMTLLGFGPAQVDQVLTAYQPPESLRVYAGDLDPRAIEVALTRNGYVKKLTGDVSILASADGDGVNFSNPMDAVAPGSFNYVLLAEDVVITTGKQAMVDLVLETLSGADGLAASLESSSLYPLMQPMAGFYLWDGQMLDKEWMGRLDSRLTPSLPPAVLFAAGITYGTEGPVVQYLVDFGDNASPDLVGIIQDRIAVQESIVMKAPISEVIGPVTVSLLPESTVLEIRGTSELIVDRWQRLLITRDLGILTTG